MRNSRRAIAAVASVVVANGLGTVVAAKKDIILARVAFDVTNGGSAPVVNPKTGLALTDEAGHPIIRHMERPGFGMRYVAEAHTLVPFFITTITLEGGEFVSRQGSNQGQMTPGVNTYISGYDLNLDKEPDLDTMDVDALNEKFKNVTYAQLVEVGYLITDWPEGHIVEEINIFDEANNLIGTEPVPFTGVEINARNYWGWTYGLPNVSGQDILVIDGRGGFPSKTIELTSTKFNEDGTPQKRTRFVTDWSKLPRVQEFLRDIYSHAPLMDLGSEENNAQLLLITKPDYMGGLTPRQSNAPSLIAEQEAAQKQAKAAAGGTKGTTANTGLDDTPTNITVEANDPEAAAAKIGVAAGVGATNDDDEEEIIEN